MKTCYIFLNDLNILLLVLQGLKTQLIKFSLHTFLKKSDSCRFFQISIGEHYGQDCGRRCRKGNLQGSKRVEGTCCCYGHHGMKLDPEGGFNEYCFHNCKIGPSIVVPGKETGEESVLWWNKQKDEHFSMYLLVATV
ncbi:uncharacterized protein LOC111391970 [Olea europaea var. sylvestris]|uniref:uncharacterized protein LOC111391970 n=1 Tax=Olea europaea var. sylvestris TaxID=158386 RepID=UPI000C1CE998|nr:uncharacterized protein LOC111391970 [Olea europaea var. sylvestris]